MKLSSVGRSLVGRRKLMFAAAAVGVATTLGHVGPAAADSVPKAEVMIIHATKCEKKSVDPQIGDAPPALGYDCLKLVDKRTLPLPLNQPVTTLLPNGRTFQLVHSAKLGPRFRVVASVSPADGSPGFTKLAEITADANKPFNVGGFAYKEGVLVLTVKIAP